ncbi:MAG TPA: hypothetical protein VIU11_27590 [Nakamurella sp.]
MHQPAKPPVRQSRRQPGPQPAANDVGVDDLDIGASGDDGSDGGRLPGAGHATEQHGGAATLAGQGFGRVGGDAHRIESA